VAAPRAPGPGTGLIALTRAVSPRLAECELTHRSREPIDVERASAEHAAYEAALAALGCEVKQLPPAPEHPDSVFVEDTALVLDEVAVVMRPGAPSRRGETPAMAEALREWRPVVSIEAPGTVDGGDILPLGRRLYVGASGRSNGAGMAQLAAHVAPHGYEVVPVPTQGCLHLKSAATEVAERLLLVNPAWVDASIFAGWDSLPVHPDEPDGANALRIGEIVLHAAGARRTGRRLDAIGIQVIPLDTTELTRAEAGVTCCSVLVRV
jgi:dimethylargininase